MPPRRGEAPLIGVFDSGTGGLTALSHLRGLLPHADLCFFGDTAHLPFGTRTDTEVRRLFLDAFVFFRRLGARALLSACGTVSCAALPFISHPPIPLFGVVESAARQAAKITSHGRVAVIATEAAIRSRRYEEALFKEDPSLSVLPLPCPSLVPLAEEGRTDDGALRETARAISPLFSWSPDVLLLGCTHFVRLSPLFSRLLPLTVLVDAGEAAARDLAKAVPDEGKGRLWIFVSRDAEAFDRSAAKLSASGFPAAHLLKSPRVPL